MNFAEYLEVKFTNNSIGLQTSFSLPIDGEVKAIHFIIQNLRRFFTVISVPKLVVSYFLMKAGVIAAPKKIELPKPERKQPPPPVCAPTAPEVPTPANA